MINNIEISNLEKKYNDFKLKIENLCIPKGVIVGLIGENGAGKTTTINLLLNEICRDSGIIKILNKDNIQFESILKEEIGVIFDECYFPEILSSKEVGKIMKKIYLKWNENLYFDYISRFKLPIKKPIGQFSKGMRAKLSIAVALSHNPQILVLDEATSALDPVIRDEILDILLEFVSNEENSILFSSHITSDLQKISDYIVFLHNGRIVFKEKKEDILCNYGIIKCGVDKINQIGEKDIITFVKEDYGYRVLIKKKKNWK